MSALFIPMRLTGRATVRNSFSISTASQMILPTVSGLGRRSRWEKRRQAKSVCSPSSREMSSLEKVRPGINPRFFNQKMDAKEPARRRVRSIPLTRKVKRTREEDAFDSCESDQAFCEC